MVENFEVLQMHEIACEDFVGFIAKGHVDKTAFVEAIRYEFDRAISIADVEHLYYREVNSPAGSAIPRQFIESKPGRGAFPVTVFQI